MDIILITESHLTDTSNFILPDFKIYTANHPDGTAHAGAAILIKSSIKHYLLLQYQKAFLQGVAVVIEDTGGDLVAASVYCPPKHKITHNMFKDFFDRLGGRFLAGGDWNAKHTVWGSRLITTRGRQLKNCIDDKNYRILTTREPTYWPTDRSKIPDLLDFLISSGISNLYTKTESCYDVAGDHSPVIVTLSTSVIQQKRPERLSSNKTDWEAFRKIIQNEINLKHKLKTRDDIDDAVVKFTNLIQEAAWKTTPTVKHSYQTNHNFSLEVKERILEKRRLRRVWHVSRLASDKTALNKAAAELKRFLANIENETVQSHLEALSPQLSVHSKYSLWKATQHLSQPQLAEPPIEYNDKWAKTDEEKAEAFASHLKSVFQENSGNNQESWEKEVDDYLQSDYQMSMPIRAVSPKELQKEIRKLELRKAPGFDLITAEILRELPQKAVIYLTYLINSIFRLSYFPSIWKISDIIMIHKEGKPPNLASSYRPISLLPVMSKLFEGLFNNRLQPIISKGNLLPNHQFGFRKMHSTIEQLHRVCNKIRESFEKKEYCSAVFLDVQQAFDRVWHKGLLYKLKMVLPHTYYSLLESYLSERLFRVKCKEAHSKLYDIKAGVPQGSVLGPSLYSLYTADIPQSRNVTTATYADDTAALSSSKTPEQASKQLQEYLGEMDKWLEKWKIKASASKSVHITFTLRQGNCPPVKLGGEALKHVDNVKYLGMHLDRKQTWKHHIQQKRNAINLKTRELEWLINPRSRLSLENKLLVYTSILKPLWTYGIELWGTASTSNIQVIQRCQNAILRKISNAPLFTKTSEIHEYLKVPTVLEEVRSRTARYRTRLQMHVNPLAAQLTNELNCTRLKRHKILDLDKRGLV